MQHERTTTRRPARVLLAVGAALIAVTAGVLSPSAATAAPRTSAQAGKLVEAAAQQLTVVDEQVHQAELTVAAQARAAAAAAQKAAIAKAALARYEPQMRAIAQSGYAAKTQSRMAAFLTSASATELVQQMTTLDMIATHTESVIAQVAIAQETARRAQAAADQLASKAKAGLAELKAQQAAVQKKIDAYKADFARLTATEQAAVTTALSGPRLAVPSADSLPLAPGSAAAVAVKAALAQVGKPYVWGSSGPNGFDCSGLTSYAWGMAGVALVHSSRGQSQLGHEVSRSQLQPGDLVYFYSPVSHVGLYIGNGMMVHARTFGQPVAVTSVDQSGYRGARRIFG
ncbi:MAG: Cell wall-associated hydrolase [Blastococcus sp.]|nr:Cell wall-associated hydrolase [Blastococcus sp.]